MPAVRYVALAALVVWLGGILQALDTDFARHMTALAYVCGSTIVIGLFVMKFVGPPPHAFIVRVALAMLMLAITAYATFRGATRMTVMVTAIIGFILLSWYARE